MHPLLIKIGPIAIHTYGFMVAIGFLACMSTVRRLSERSKLKVDRVLDMCFWSLLVGFAGARLLFVLTRLDYFVTDPLSAFKVWEGGLVFFGGPLAVLPFIYWYMKKHGLPLWKTMDTMVPGLTIAHMFGRFGCVAAGCCYGRPTGTNFGLKLDSELVDASLRGVPLHPTQLYEAGALLVLFVGLLWVFKRKQFDGQVMLTYFMAYPIIRSIVEIYRGDLIRGFVIEGILSTSQFISILVFLGATAALVYRLRTLQGRKAIA